MVPLEDAQTLLSAGAAVAQVLAELDAGKAELFGDPLGASLRLGDFVAEQADRDFGRPREQDGGGEPGGGGGIEGELDDPALGDGRSGDGSPSRPWR
jgi:fermentation-respiration switch protein FrsA (DUF1100 family)